MDLVSELHIHSDKCILIKVCVCVVGCGGVFFQRTSGVVVVCVCVCVHRNTGVAVEVGESRLISGAALYAQDKDTPPDDITYIIDSVLSHGLLTKKACSH